MVAIKLRDDGKKRWIYSDLKKEKKPTTQRESQASGKTGLNKKTTEQIQAETEAKNLEIQGIAKPEVVRPGETIDSAYQRSRTNTQRIMEQAYPNKEVSYNTYYTTYSETPQPQTTSKIGERKPLTATITPNRDLTPFATSNTILQTVINQAQGLKTETKTMTAGEARKQGLFTMYTSETPITTTITRPDWNNPKTQARGLNSGLGTPINIGTTKDLTYKQIFGKELTVAGAEEYRNYEGEWLLPPTTNPSMNRNLPATTGQRFGLLWQKTIREPGTKLFDNLIDLSKQPKIQEASRIGLSSIGPVGFYMAEADRTASKRGNQFTIIEATSSIAGGAGDIYLRNPAQTISEYGAFKWLGNIVGGARGWVLPKLEKFAEQSPFKSKIYSLGKKVGTGTLVLGTTGVAVAEISLAENPVRKASSIATEGLIAWKGFERGLSQGTKFGETKFFEVYPERKGSGGYSYLITEPAKSNINIVPDFTIPRSRGELLGLQGKRLTGSSLTPDAWVSKSWTTITGERGVGVGPMRSENLLLNMYFSSPISVKQVNVNNKVFGGFYSPTKKIFKKPYVRSYTQTPFYTAYVGDKAINAVGGSSYSFAFFKSKPQAMQVIDEVGFSPLTKGSAFKINIEQLKNPGKLFVPAENIAGLSVEGQFIAPAKILEPGFEWTAGSSIMKTSGRRRIIYYEKPTGTLANYDITRGVNIEKSAMDFFFGPRYTRLEVVPTKLKANLPSVESQNLFSESSRRTSTSSGGRSGSSSGGVREITIRPAFSTPTLSSGRSSDRVFSYLSSVGFSSGAYSLSSSIGRYSLSSSLSSSSGSSMSSALSSSSPYYSSSGYSYFSSSGSSSSGSGSSSGSSYSSSSTPGIPNRVVEFGLPSMADAFGGRGKRKRGGLRGGYAPSVTAVVFNIKGVMPKNYESGLVLRPILRGGM